MLSLVKRFVPAIGPVSPAEQLRAAVGALIGIFLTGAITRLALGGGASVPLLIAPMGASAVLLFAVPSSPLAQPWSILGGNLVASLVGVTAAAWIPSPFLAAAVGVSAAIGLMLALRCVHPPSGAVALTAVLGGPSVTAVGYGFVLWPVAVNSLVLLAVALAYNNLTGRRYPLVAATGRPPQAAPEESRRVGFSHDDVVAVLRDYDQVIDVDPTELEDLLQRAQIHALDRRSGGLTCADIMTRNVMAVSPGTPILDALELLRSGRIKVLPVTNDKAQVVGVLTQTDLLDKVEWDHKGPRLGLGRRVRQALNAGRAPDGVVEEIMSTPVHAVTAQTRVAALVPLMSQSGLHHIPVLDANGQLAGVVSQADLIAALIEGRNEEAAPAAGRAAQAS
ncbi:HPP family protein [Azorhizobium doebereinerae]|uniref:HPP family protein n=1 Tax=Azorhizobium doebereinerae TaxID=281091 RepID=UPI00049212BD|nr:HPP family protein [Azorhizobium doebereinerae]